MYRLDELSKLETTELSTLFIAMQDNLTNVTHFREDVCYDYTTIAQAYYTEDTPSDYTWIVRDCGTWLVNKRSSMYEHYMDNYKSNYEHFEQYSIHIGINNLVLEREADYVKVDYDVLDTEEQDAFKVRCCNCAYLVEGDNSEWICDIDRKEIHDIDFEDCPTNYLERAGEN